MPTLAKRRLPPRAAPRTDALHARMADAPGRALPARVQRDAREGGELSRAREDAIARHGSDAAAARAVSARRGDPVLRHPDRARRDGSRALFRRWRRAPFRAHRRRRGLDRAARGAGHGPASLRVRRGGRNQARARGPRAADRLRRQPVHARVLHDRRRGEPRLRGGAPHGPWPAGPAAASRRGERARGGGLPQRADRGGRRRGDALRYLGRVADD